MAEQREAETHRVGRTAPRWGITFPQLLAFVAVMLPILAALRFSISTIDLAYLIRAGEGMLHTGQLANTDTFTFTVAGREWLNQQWGADITFALISRVGAWEALAVARASLVGIIFWLEFLACRAAGAGRRAAAWLTLGAFVVCLDGLAMRPQLLGLTFFALSLWIVSDRTARPRLLWLLPLIVLVWANVHGSFVLAPMLLVLAWLEDRREQGREARRLLIVAIACVAVANVNPWGPAVWAYVANLTTDPRVREFIQEWQPTRPTSFLGASFFVSVATVAWIAIRRRPRLPWPRIAALIMFVVLGLQAVRGVLWWGLAAPVLVASLFPDRERSSEERRPLNLVIAAVLALLVIPLLPWSRPAVAHDANSFKATDGLVLNAPEGLSTAVQQRTDPGSRLFVAQIWASWFELALPSHPVFVDPRIEVFPAEVWSDYDTVSTSAPGWEDVLERWDVDALVLSRRQQSELIAALEHHPGWTVIRDDEDGVALVRSPEAGVGINSP